MILRSALPDPFDVFLDNLTALFDKRHAELVEPLFLGQLLAHGRRTATAWFRAGDIAEEFRRGYTLLGTLGKSKVPAAATLLFRDLCRTLHPGLAGCSLSTTRPRNATAPVSKGAGIHHNPTPGPTDNKFLYGHIWVSMAWVVRHPQWHTLALPLLADLYIREKDRPGLSRTAVLSS